MFKMFLLSVILFCLINYVRTRFKGELLVNWLRSDGISDEIKSLSNRIIRLDLHQCVDTCFEHPRFIDHCLMISKIAAIKFNCNSTTDMICRLSVYYLDRYDNPDTYHRFVENFSVHKFTNSLSKFDRKSGSE